jgi:hypothetical protein
MFLLGQQSWPPTVAITPDPASGKPGTKIELTASADIFTGETTTVTFGELLIEADVAGPRRAIFSLPPGFPARLVTASAEGLSFDITMQESTIPIEDTQAFFDSLQAAMEQGTSVVVADLTALMADLPEEDRYKVQGNIDWAQTHPDLYMADFQNLISNYPDFAHALANLLDGAELVSKLNNYTGYGFATAAKACADADDALRDTADFASSQMGAIRKMAATKEESPECDQTSIWKGVSDVDAQAMEMSEHSTALAYIVGLAFAGVYPPAAVEQAIHAIVGTIGVYTLGSALVNLGAPLTLQEVILTVHPSNYIQSYDTATLDVQARIKSREVSLRNAWDVLLSIAGRYVRTMNQHLHNWFFGEWMPLAEEFMDPDEIFTIRDVTEYVYGGSTDITYQTGGIVDVHMATDPGHKCYELTVDPITEEGQDTVYVSWTMGEITKTASENFYVTLGLFVEEFTGADGIYPGDSGYIEGDLGFWRYVWSGNQISTPPCDELRFIEVWDGELTAHECHHEAGGTGWGGVRVWLDYLKDDLDRYPLDQVDWSFSSEGEFGPTGFAEMKLGTYANGMQTYTSSGSRAMSGDRLFLLPPGEGDTGSMYIGFMIYSDYADEEPDYSQAHATIGNIVVDPSGPPEPYPHVGVGMVAETWHGQTMTYKPLISEYNLFTGISFGDVMIPGNLGTWWLLAEGTQQHVAPCRSRVELHDGVADVIECHHEHPISSEGKVRLFLTNLDGRLSEYQVSSVEFDLSGTGHAGPGGQQTFAFGFNIAGRIETWSLFHGQVNLTEPNLFALVGDGTSNPDFYLRLYEYSDYEPPEHEETSEYISTINALHFYGELPAD